MADRSFLTENDAERMKARAGTPFRPSNGFEGELFYGQWCADCRCDAAFRADPDNNRGCPIWVDAQAFVATDPDYPKALIWGDDGQPRCTAHQPED